MRRTIASTAFLAALNLAIAFQAEAMPTPMDPFGLGTKSSRIAGEGSSAERDYSQFGEEWGPFIKQGHEIKNSATFDEVAQAQRNLRSYLKHTTKTHNEQARKDGRPEIPLDESMIEEFVRKQTKSMSGLDIKGMAGADLISSVSQMLASSSRKG